MKLKIFFEVQAEVLTPKDVGELRRPHQLGEPRQLILWQLQ
jgi:hypothetical protein